MKKIGVKKLLRRVERAVKTSQIQSRSNEYFGNTQSYWLLTESEKGAQPTEILNWPTFSLAYSDSAANRSYRGKNPMHVPAPKSCHWAPAYINAVIWSHDDSIKGISRFANQSFSTWADDFSQTMLNCIDNSGASIVECVACMKMKRHAKIGIGGFTSGNGQIWLRLQEIESLWLCRSSETSPSPALAQVYRHQLRIRSDEEISDMRWWSGRRRSCRDRMEVWWNSMTTPVFWSTRLESP